MAVLASLIGLLAGQAFAATDMYMSFKDIGEKTTAAPVKVTPDEKGRFVIGGVKAGTYELTIAPQPKEYAVAKVVESGAEAIKIEVTWLPMKTGKETNAPVVVKVPKDGVKVTGTVVSGGTAEGSGKAYRVEGHLGKAQPAEDVNNTLGNIGSAR